MTAMPRAASCDEDLVDLGLGADVDAARGLVDDQHLGIAGEPAGEDRPSAGCRRRGRRCAGRARPCGSTWPCGSRRGRARSSRLAHEAERAGDSGRARRRRSSRGSPSGGEDRLLLAVLRDEADAEARSRRRGEAGAYGRAVERRSCRRRWGRRRRSARASSVRPEPTRPAMPRISPAAEVEVDAGEHDGVRAPRRRAAVRRPRTERRTGPARVALVGRA